MLVKLLWLNYEASFCLMALWSLGMGLSYLDISSLVCRHLAFLIGYTSRCDKKQNLEAS